MRPTKRPRIRERTLKIAWITQYHNYSTLRMKGFDEEDLQEVKDSAPMTFDLEAKEWIVHWRDVDDVTAALEHLDFIVRYRDPQD